MCEAVERKSSMPSVGHVGAAIHLRVRNPGRSGPIPGKNAVESPLEQLGADAYAFQREGQRRFGTGQREALFGCNCAGVERSVPCNAK